MAQRRLTSVLRACNVLSPSRATQELLTPWRNDPQQLAAALDAAPAIDIHTHLLQAGAFKEFLDDGLERQRTVVGGPAATLCWSVRLTTSDGVDEAG